MSKFIKFAWSSVLVIALFALGILLADKLWLRENVIRLRVVAASDDACDQENKLLVRDAINKYLEKKLEYKYTCEDILETLRNMNFLSVAGEGYVPTYTRTDLTDSLHETFGFHTDYDIVTEKQMKKIFRETKKPEKGTRKI